MEASRPLNEDSYTNLISQRQVLNNGGQRHKSCPIEEDEEGCKCNDAGEYDGDD